MTFDSHSDASGLRVALFSGNYNCVADGANNALNHLVGHLLERGAAVKIFSPTVADPAFPPTGDLVSVPSMGFPGRSEYRISLGLNRTLKEQIRAFAPTHIHVSAPDPHGYQAQTLGKQLGIPVVTSLHTHLDHHHCLETVVLRGPTAAVQAFAQQLVALRGVRHGNIHLVPLAETGRAHRHGLDTSGPHRHYTPLS